MAIQVMQRQQEQREPEKPKHDPFDDILKGLQVAQSVTGIAVNYQNFQATRQQRELNDLNLENQKQGVSSAQEANAVFSKGGTFTAAEDGQSAIRTNGQIQRGTFNVPQKAEPTRTRAVNTTDENGNLVTKIVPDIPGQSFSAPPAKSSGKTFTSTAFNPDGSQTRTVKDGAGNVLGTEEIGVDPTKENKLEVPGFGVAKSEDDAKKAKMAVESYANIKDNLGRMMALRKEKGAEFLDRESVKKANVIATDTLLQYKEMAKLGVLSKTDEELIDRLIPSDPLQMDAPWSESTFAQLEEAETLVRNRLTNYMISRGIADEEIMTQHLGATQYSKYGPGSSDTALASKDKQPAKPGTKISVDGKMYVVGDDGDTLIEVGQ